MEPSVDSHDLLAIITTSPIPSNPSTEVIDMAISSIRQQPTLSTLLIHIICDGVKLKKNSGSFYKSGIVSEKSNQDYELFKLKLRKTYQNDPLIVIQERNERHCFADNIRFVMTKSTQPYVLIFQHDHILQREVDFPLILKRMKEFPEINYIGFMNRSVFNVPVHLWQDLKLRKHFAGLVDHTKEEGFAEALTAHYQSTLCLPLVPLIYWYDKVHIAKRDYYLDVIFNEKGYYDTVRKQWLKTVSFVEDSFGLYMRRTIEEDPSKFAQFGCYIYWDRLESTIVHTHGRAFISEEQREELHQPKKERIDRKQEQIDYNTQFMQEDEI